MRFVQLTRWRSPLGRATAIVAFLSLVVIACIFYWNRETPNQRYERAWELLHQGQRLAQDGKLDAAIDAYGRSVECDPDIPVTYRVRAAAFFEQGLHDKAISDLDEAIRRKSDDPVSLTLRGKVWLQKELLDKALTDLNEANRLDPRSHETLSTRGVVWLQKHSPERALRDFNAAIELDPQYGHYYCNRAKAYVGLGNADNAISDYQRAMDLTPSPWALEGAAWIFATWPDSQLRDGEQAVELASVACKLTNWKDASCLGTLAAAYAETGDFEKAVEWQEKAVEVVDVERRAQYLDTLQLYERNEPYRSERVNRPTD
jgi:tetratricopeptide (TPR) repeat protein